MYELVKGHLLVKGDGRLYERVVIDGDAEWLLIGDIEDGIDDPCFESDYQWLLSEYRDAQRHARDYEREVIGTWNLTRGSF